MRMLLKKLAVVFVVFALVDSGNISYAVDVEQAMNMKVQRDNYYNQFYPPCPIVSGISATINANEYRPSGKEHYQFDLPGPVEVELEMGTKVVSTVISWTLKNDKYVTNQTLTIIDDNNQRQEIKLDPSVRSYTDATAYTARIDDNNFIHGRQYRLEILDKDLGVDYGGTRFGVVDVNFRLKGYWGYSSKPILSDEDINSLEGVFLSPMKSTKNSYENLSPSGQYVYIIFPVDPKNNAMNEPIFKIKEGTPAKYNIFQLPVYSQWDLNVQEHVNSAGHSSKYNVFRTKELLTGSFNFYRD